MRFWKPRYPYNNKNYSTIEQERLRALPVSIIDPDSGADITGMNPRTGLPITRREGQTTFAKFEKGEVVMGDGSRVQAWVFDTNDPDVIHLLRTYEVEGYAAKGYLTDENATQSGGEKPIEQMNILELKALAKAKQIPGYGSMKKASLLEALSNEPSPTE